MSLSRNKVYYYYKQISEGTAVVVNGQKRLTNLTQIVIKLEEHALQKEKVLGEWLYVCSSASQPLNEHQKQLLKLMYKNIFKKFVHLDLWCMDLDY